MTRPANDRTERYPGALGVARPPNILLLITDQQRYPCHWPDEPGWRRELTPSDHELADTGPGVAVAAIGLYATSVGAFIGWHYESLPQLRARPRSRRR